MSKEYHDGSLQELSSTAVPLMLSFLASMAMMFVDRLFLARYSLLAHNAVITAGTISWAFVFSLNTFCEMSGVYVAQLNGAKRKAELGRPCWQVLWIALSTFVIFVPLAIWGGEWFFGSEDAPSLMQQDYFFWIMLFGPLFGMNGALSAFFIGQGRTITATLVITFGNVVNALLDPLLIFGWGDVVPSMGVEGAALATVLSLMVTSLILWILFLRPEHRREFGTAAWRFDPRLMRRLWLICLPPAIYTLFEVGSWGIFYRLMEERGPIHLTVAGVAQNFAILFLFYGLGLHKGASAIAGNLIGAGRTHALQRLFRSGLALTLFFFALCALILIVNADQVTSWFLQNPLLQQGLDGHQQIATGETLKQLVELTKLGLLITCFYVVCENLRLFLSGLLVASGDTIYLLCANLISILGFLLLPAYIMINRYEASVETSMALWLAYGILSVLLLYGRFIHGGWRKTSNQTLPSQS